MDSEIGRALDAATERVAEALRARRQEKEEAVKPALLRPPRWLMRESKTALARRVVELTSELAKWRSDIVPVTLEQDMQAGMTIQVRVPKRFERYERIDR